MTITMEVERPSDVRITLSCTMTLAQWSTLSGSLTEGIAQHGKYNGDVAAFRNCVDSAIEQLRGKVSGGPLRTEEH